MDFCNHTTIAPYFRIKNLDGIEAQTLLYKIFVPILLIFCVFSVALNAILVIAGTASRHSVRSRSPILVLSLNLAATDGLASFFIGLGLIVNSFLPVVFGVNMAKQNCFVLVVENLRMSALIASALHLLALALVHYKGIANPLHYR